MKHEAANSSEWFVILEFQDRRFLRRFFLDVFMFLFEPVNGLLATNILRRFHIRPVVVCEAIRPRLETLSWVRLSI